MATVGVVLFRNAAQESKPILQESMKNSININNNNSEGPKIEKREIIIVRKKQKIVPSEVKRPSKSSETRGAAPQAVARRNARERNRVRQVNNGFAALRRHIPEDVAEAFENANSNRGPNKKLSKVETLRMAVEYIRSLEKLLDIGDGKENSLSPSMISFPSPASSSPRDRSNYDRSYFSLDSPLMDDDDEDSNPPTPLPPAKGHQYARIPGTNNFQLVAAPLMYEDEENNQPLTPSSDLIMQDDLMVNTQLLDASYQFMHAAEQEFTIIEPGNIQPGQDSNITIHEPSALSGMDQKYVTIPLSELQGHLMNEEAVILGHINTVDPRLVLPDDKIACLPNHHAGVMVENSVIMNASDYYIQDSILKAEIPDIDDDEEEEDCENTQNLQEVMDWWKQKGGQS